VIFLKNLKNSIFLLKIHKKNSFFFARRFSYCDRSPAAIAIGNFLAATTGKMVKNRVFAKNDLFSYCGCERISCCPRSRAARTTGKL
jgi:hypothetical protein